MENSAICALQSLAAAHQTGTTIALRAGGEKWSFKEMLVEKCLDQTDDHFVKVLLYSVYIDNFALHQIVWLQFIVSNLFQDIELYHHYIRKASNDFHLTTLCPYIAR